MLEDEGGMVMGEGWGRGSEGGAKLNRDAMILINMNYI